MVAKIDDIHHAVATLGIGQSVIMQKLNTIHEAIEAKKEPQPTSPVSYYPENVKRLLSYLADGYKIEAIREIRSIGGFGLKEAKDIVEDFFNRKPR